MKPETLIVAAVLAAFWSAHNELVGARGYARHYRAMRNTMERFTGRLPFVDECAFDRAMRAALSA